MKMKVDLQKTRNRLLMFVIPMGIYCIGVGFLITGNKSDAVAIITLIGMFTVITNSILVGRADCREFERKLKEKYQ